MVFHCMGAAIGRPMGVPPIASSTLMLLGSPPAPAHCVYTTVKASSPSIRCEELCLFLLFIIPVKACTANDLHLHPYLVSPATLL